MRIIRRIRVAAIAVGSILAACSGDKSTGPSPSSSALLGQALSEMSLPQLNILGVRLVAPVADFPSLSPSDCTYDPSSQSFACGAKTLNGFTLTSSYALLALGGATQSQFDPSTTDGVRTRTHLAGTVAMPTGTITIDDQRELVLTGLLSSTHVINGTGVTHTVGTVNAGATPIPMSSTLTTSVVGLTIPNGARYPTAGTMTADVTRQLSTFPIHVTHFVAVFDGTSTISITVSGDGGPVFRCAVDLAGAGTSCAF
jgi:hypothetical protein